MLQHADVCTDLVVYMTMVNVHQHGRPTDSNNSKTCCWASWFITVIEGLAQKRRTVTKRDGATRNKFILKIIGIYEA